MSTNVAIQTAVQDEQEYRVVKATKEMDFSYEIPITTDTRTVAQFMSMLDVFKFNDPIQRNADAWSIETKSVLIISMIDRVAIGKISVQIKRGGGKKIRNVLDGKQRLTTIRDFVKGKFAIACNKYVYGMEGLERVWVDINGMYFSDLPEEYQNRIMATLLVIEEYDIDDKMKFDLFQRWNSGVQLKPAQIRKSKMTYYMLGALAKYKVMDVFKYGFSPTAINNEQNADMILQAMAVLVTDNNTSLDNTRLNKLLDEKTIGTDVIDSIETIGSYIESAVPHLDEKTLNKAFGKTKTVSLIYVAKTAIEEHRSAEDFAAWMTNFFVKDYAKSGFGTTSGTAKLDSVKRRNEIIMKNYRNFFAS